VDPDRGRKDANQGPDANYLGRALASSTTYPMDWNVSTYKVQVVPIGQANPAFFEVAPNLRHPHYTISHLIADPITTAVMRKCIASGIYTGPVSSHCRRFVAACLTSGCDGVTPRLPFVVPYA
jgi:hypothetical protein